jgi:hypothetical protein
VNRFECGLEVLRERRIGAEGVRPRDVHNFLAIPSETRACVATSGDDETRGPARADSCADCAAPLAGDQRYCLRCGARHGALPAAIASRLAILLRRDRRDEPTSSEDLGSDSGSEDEAGRSGPAGFMPSPRAAAVAVLGMLALGVMLGSATSQIAQSAGLSSILLEVTPSPPPPEAIAEAPAAAPAAGAESSPLLPASTSSLVPAPLPPETPLPEAPAEPTPPPEIPEAETLPPVKHVFVIALGENSFEESFGAASPAPYLAKTLREKGELIDNYYAVTKGDLANQIALLSGQGPTPETAAGCPTYTDIAPGTLSPEGQVEGSGCVYPSTTPTLPAQLAEKKLTWKAYVEDIDNGAIAGQPTSCRHPATGESDPSQAPVPGDAYLTWRNPFVYFHALVDDGECGRNDVGLDQLALDLKTAAKTPALSYLVPNACHDGGEAPCEPGLPSGVAETEAFLQAVVPEIEASPAYEEGGLIAIVSTQARQTGATPDTSACCVIPEYPNLPPVPAAEPSTGPVKPIGGGGKVGLLLISPFVEAGSSEAAGYYNHYSLLLTIEELFELEKLGYANELALAPFGETVFNAAPETALTEPPTK